MGGSAIPPPPPSRRPPASGVLCAVCPRAPWPPTRTCCIVTPPHAGADGATGGARGRGVARWPAPAPLPALPMPRERRRRPPAHPSRPPPPPPSRPPRRSVQRSTRCSSRDRRAGVHGCVERGGGGGEMGLPSTFLFRVGPPACGRLGRRPPPRQPPIWRPTARESVWSCDAGVGREAGGGRRAGAAATRTTARGASRRRGRPPPFFLLTPPRPFTPQPARPWPLARSTPASWSAAAAARRRRPSWRLW